MTTLILTLSGEIAIKSERTRKRFEHLLLNNISKVLNIKSYKFEQGLILIETEDDFRKLEKVFGIAHFYKAERIEFDTLERLVEKSKEYFKEKVKGKKFAVRVKRVGRHNFTSLDVAKIIGSALYPYSKGVDLENPEIEVHVYIRDNEAYFYTEVFNGPRGYPVGSTGKTVVLFSGGIDSPTATWLMMKRGVLPIILNFKLGGELHKNMVINELRVLREWSGGHKLRAYFIDAMPILLQLSKVKEYLRIVMLKRIMYLTADKLAERVGALSITTGESLSQVSSQTMKNLYVTEYGINRPVFRPLIGFDKSDIIDLAKRIGTYELSIKLPEYCTLAGKSTISADLEEVLEEEKKIQINLESLIENAEKVEV